MNQISGLVLIDDTQTELDELQSAFNRSGIASLPILFAKDAPGSGIDHIELDNFEPRIIITDLNLRDIQTASTSAFFGVIFRMLESINPTKPYLLYFWSKHADFAEGVIEQIYKRARGRYLLPLGWGILNKHDFIGEEDKTILQQKVKSIITDTPLFHAIYDWETRVAKAAQATATTIVQLGISQADTELEGLEYLADQHAHIDTILSAIGNEAVGKDNAAEAKNEAVDLGLMPILEDHLHMMSLENGAWNGALNNIGKRITLQPDTVASLNSFFHTSNLTESTSKTDKGVMVSLNPELLDSRDAQHKLESKLGISLEHLMHEEFLSKNKLGMSTADSNAHKKAARDKTRLGFIELSADCDQAQRKVKLNRYVLCALIPEEYIKLASTHGTSARPRDTAHDGIYKVPFILIENERFLLKLSFKYQFGTKPSCSVNGLEYENKWFGEPILRLREQILNEISHNCAQYSTRPGIISFH
ncbi:hypothetical protein L8S00_05460 [Vibrio splendidus]|uniref:hypothetical protein n=1 Tax=Vibrio splendidus TaxID=29497 RepID=UPI002469B998|nr:hypothetical protein [Vibrio splendidus]MDH5902845.1 hypothetical protein [Vibrio splendidus]